MDFKFGSLLCLLLAILHHLLFFNNLIKTNKTILLIKHNRTEFGVGKSEAGPLGLAPKWGQVHRIGKLETGIARALIESTLNRDSFFGFTRAIRIN